MSKLKLSLFVVIFWICFDGQAILSSSSTSSQVTSYGLLQLLASSSTFSQVSSDSLLQLLASYENVSTALDCARVCHANKESEPPCKGFLLKPGSCGVYTDRINPTSNSTGATTTSAADITTTHATTLITTEEMVHHTSMTSFTQILGPPENVTYYYYLSSGKKSYIDAQDACADAGGYLLHFDSLDEYDAVLSFLSLTGYEDAWVGANDMAVENQWVSQKTGMTLDSNWQWNQGEPNGFGDENCAFLVHNTMRMADNNCAVEYHYICESDTSGLLLFI